MKKNFIFTLMLTLLLTGCSLASKPVGNNSASNQSNSTAQEQANNLSAQVQVPLVEENEDVKNNLANENSNSSTTADKNEEISNTLEKWVNTPAEIKTISVKNNVTFLSIDILSHNPKFLPGVTDFFINQSEKIRDVSINDNTKSYLCGAGEDDNYNTADVPTDTGNLLAAIQRRLSNKEYPIYYFDIDNNVVGSIYEQCLP